MTLIELVLAIVILGIGVAALLTVFSSAARGSADPMLHKQMLAIAEEMMEEIVLKPYVVTANAVPAACARNTFNDVGDYNGYSTTVLGTICDVDGNQIAALNGYTVQITVLADATTFAGNAVTDAKKITVTVTHGAESISLVGWRSNFAS
jgi:MSHA pilin protein MshD